MVIRAHIHAREKCAENGEERARHTRYCEEGGSAAPTPAQKNHTAPARRPQKGSTERRAVQPTTHARRAKRSALCPRAQWVREHAMAQNLQTGTLASWDLGVGPSVGAGGVGVIHGKIMLAGKGAPGLELAAADGASASGAGGGNAKGGVCVGCMCGWGCVAVTVVPPFPSGGKSERLGMGTRVGRLLRCMGAGASREGCA